MSALSDGGDVQKKEVVSCGNVKECMIEEWGCGSERGHATDAIPDLCLSVSLCLCLSLSLSCILSYQVKWV